MNLLFYFEFSSGAETKQQSYDDLRGIPIPNVGDSICPGQGQCKILSRTFSYHSQGLTIYFLCE
ncbi:hypothetical protein HDF17_001381 [Granulicella arctica]|uniref:Uncharacterized protein n=1 Tax=Granulicella arctica TaxID=940613 RepID=A0A7Y9PG51_9BACT|nr:hypothetical protein [Granulicella arctica]